MLTFKQLREMMKAQGSGTLAVRTLDVSSFTRLHLSVRGTIHFVVGPTEKVEIEADDNLLDYVEVVNSGRTLYVTGASKLRGPVYTTLRITVYLRQLNALNISADGDVDCPDPLRLDTPLELKIQSNGNVSLHVEVPTLTANIASDGSTTLRGSADEAQIRVASHGHFFGRDFHVQHLRLRNASDGNVEVWAEQTIALQHRGNGYLHYGGPARLTDVSQLGSGPVKHVE